MSGRQTTNPATSASIIPMLLVGLSLLLNLGLAVHLLSRKPAGQFATETANEGASAVMPAAAVAPAATDTAAPIATEAEFPAFHWSEIESTDYRQYVANLRALGVPEQVIRDIIVADVNQIYTKRARDIWQQRSHEYWQKYSNEKPDPKQVEQLITLGKEHAAMLQELLGARIGRQELIDTLYLQVTGGEQQLLFLPAERRAAALNALVEADFESKEMKLHGEGRYSTKDEQKLFNEKLAVLKEVLSPEELEAFHRRNSPAGAHLKSEVRYFNLTAEEYQQLLLAREASFGEKGTKDLVQKLFGAERAQEFERVGSAFYQNARTGAEAEGIPLERVDQAAKLANDAVSSGFAAAQDKNLSVEERKARLKELELQAESKIKELLGDKAAKTVLRDVRNVLRSSASMIQP
ncbi:MAG: hypothetical protein AAB370_10540 [Verrucomicrobiota bacterium]